MPYKDEERLRSITQGEWNKFTTNQKYNRINAARKFSNNPLSHLSFDEDEIVKERSRVMNQKRRPHKVINPVQTNQRLSFTNTEDDHSSDAAIMADIRNFLIQVPIIQSNIRKLTRISTLRTTENEKLKTALQKLSGVFNEVKIQFVKVKSDLNRVMVEMDLEIKSLNIIEADDRTCGNLKQ
jgi:hypothetical protein